MGVSRMGVGISSCSEYPRVPGTLVLAQAELRRKQIHSIYSDGSFAPAGGSLSDLLHSTKSGPGKAGSSAVWMAPDKSIVMSVQFTYEPGEVPETSAHQAELYAILGAAMI